MHRKKSGAPPLARRCISNYAQLVTLEMQRNIDFKYKARPLVMHSRPAKRRFSITHPQTYLEGESPTSW